MQSPNASSIASIITTPMPPASPTTLVIAARLEAGLKKFERMSVKKLSTELGLSIPFVRNALVHHYGIGITFTKGRTGGITLDKDYLIGR